MTKTSVKIIADSITKQGHRATTLILTFPRIVLAELATHRMLSKNSSSSRAEGIKHKIDRVDQQLFIPDKFSKNCKGMSNKEWLNDDQEIRVRSAHSEYWDDTKKFVKELAANDVHKQHANRYLESFEYITVIITGTEWENFFEQRAPKYTLFDRVYRSKKQMIAEEGKVKMMNYLWDKEQGGLGQFIDIDDEDFLDYTKLYNHSGWHKLNTNTAQPEMMELAEMMWDTMNDSEPKLLRDGEWHIPFGDNIDGELAAKARTNFLDTKYPTVTYQGECCSDYGRLEFLDHEQQIEEAKLMVAVARCARVSYLNHEGKDDYDADMKLYDFLVEQKHQSPLEHCLRAMSDEEYNTYIKGVIEYERDPETGDRLNTLVIPDEAKGWCANMRGFITHRTDIGY